MNFYVLLTVTVLFIAGAYGTDNASLDPRPSITCNPSYMSVQSCQNFARYCLNELNDQIRLELTSSYTYDAMAAYFARDDVAYRGFAKFFSKMADEARDHAKKIQNYVVTRGGRVHYKSIPTPATEWSTPLSSMKKALELERRINEQLLDIHWLAQDKNDPHLQNFLESDFLPEQVDFIKQMSDWIAILTRVQADPLGWTIFDQELYEGERT